MIDAPVDEIVQQIVAAFHPRRVMMFGSRARGEVGVDSDLDLFVEMESNLPPRQRVRVVNDLFGLRRWAMDVVVYTPDEVQQMKDTVGTLLYTIEREGKVLYEQA